MPNQKRICYVVFVRHGQTNYTDVFPDITPAGEHSLIQTASQIATFALGQRIQIYSSPKPRALGSASCLAQSLGLDPVETILVPDLTACEQRQPEKVMKLVKQHLSSTNPLAIEEAYWTEEAFDDPKIIEPRAEIRKRFYVFLNRLIQVGLLNVIPSCYVCVAHAEVIGHLVKDMGIIADSNISPVIEYAQPVFLTISQAKINQPVFVDCQFKNFNAEACTVQLLQTRPAA